MPRSKRRSNRRDDQVSGALVKALVAKEDHLDIIHEQGLLCEGLISALISADKCKKYVTEGEPLEACLYFVKACSLSVHSIQSLQSCFPKLIRMLDTVEEGQSLQYQLHGKPAVLQATELILFGYHIRDLADSTAESLLLLNINVTFHPDVETCHGLDRADIKWLHHLGRFKAASRMAFCCEVLQQSLDNMVAERPLDPTVLEACSLHQQLMAYALDSQHSGASEASRHTPDFSKIRNFVNRGVQGTLQFHQDAAALMHLVLQSMYIILKECRAQPDSDTSENLIDTADLWHTLYMTLRGISREPFGNLWYNVRDRMEAAMLLLGRTFPLRKCLKGHILVDIIEDSHQICTAELMLQRLQEQTDLQTATTEADSTEGWDGSPNCARCNRRMWREGDITFTSEKVRLQWFASNGVHEPLPCKCGAVAYCSPNCMQLDKADHRAKCKRHQLRNKLAGR